MSLSEPDPLDFPLISLQPVTNPQHVWWALLLHSHPAADPPTLLRLFGEYGLNDALGGLSCLVPLADPGALSGDQVSQLPAERIILLIPLSWCCDPAVAADLEHLQTQGFRLMAQGLPRAGQKLSSAVSALAIDFSAADAPRRPESLRQLPGPHLALGVDTSAGFEQAIAAGCSRCAGEYSLHPLPTRQQQGPPRVLLLKLLALLASDADSHDIEKLLKQTPALSYQLLKLVNSVSFALTTKIANFGHAITLLGRRQLQRWLQLLLYAQQSGDQRNPLMACAALRASLTEALCKASGGDREEQERAFMVGMFSLLDALFAMPLADLVTPLNLAEDVVDALLRRGGRLGALLSVAEQSERAERAESKSTSDFAGQLAASGLTPASYCQSQVQACRWTIQVNQGT